jgi:pimeloyl-ACP methyl ester carboxylesterase
MRKYLLLLAVILFGAGIQAQRPVDNSPYAKTVASFSKWYADNASDSIYTLFDGTVRSRVSTDAWRKVFPQIKGKIGALGSFTRDAGGKGYVNYAAYGQNSAMGLTLSLDSNYLIQGIFPRQSAALTSYHTNYKIPTPDGELAGELMVPNRTNGYKPPVVLIIAGSGPTDRNGNSMLGLHTDCYRQLAVELDKQGIASLRYDKRWVGESLRFSGKLDSLRFEDYVNDAKACIRQLRADTNFYAVYVIGHSEGALIGAIAAREEKADGVISLAGAGVPAGMIIRRQLAHAGLDSAAAERALDSLEKGKEIYMSSWNSYSPAREISKLKMPVTIIQGLRDEQVSKEDAEKLAAAAPKAQLIFMDSMNHVLKKAPADREGNLATYSNPQLPIYPDLVPAIVSFIRSRKKK